VRERFHRRVLVRDRRVELDVQQALELAGEHDNIARRKPEVIERDGRIDRVSPRRIRDPRLQPGGELTFGHALALRPFLDRLIPTAYLSGTAANALTR